MRSSGEVPVTNAEPGTGREGSNEDGSNEDAPDGGGPVSGGPGAGRSGGGWRHWLPRLIKPARRGVLLFILVLVVEYLVVPELVGASKDLYLLGTINASWVAAGVALEGLSLFCYAVLTRLLLPH